MISSRSSADTLYIFWNTARVSRSKVPRQPGIDEIGLQIPHALLQPRLVGMAALQEIIDSLGVHEPAVCRSSASISPGPNLPFLTTSSGL